MILDSKTPNANRIHIGIFGKTNSGKSSLINALTGQEVSIVADVAGTTTDPVYKAMEMLPLGPCVFIDTAGFDDYTDLGEKRLEKTKGVVDKCDLAVVVVAADATYLEKENEWEESYEKKWYETLKQKKIPTMFVVTKSDLFSKADKLVDFLQKETKVVALSVSTTDKTGIEKVREQLVRLLPEDYGVAFITGNLVQKEDLILLVMPQDAQAPKGRLILPQVQTLRELLDKRCLVTCVATEQLEDMLAVLKKPPKLIITDSQVFDYVYERTPKETMLTSFSVLFAGYKGDIAYYTQSAKVIDTLTEKSKVLIAESCTHAPKEEDIGRVKIPAMLRKRVGEALKVDVVSGMDFPEKLNEYDLIIQCGGCMFNRKYMLSRIEKAKELNVPITNYGIAIAYLKGILDKVSYTC